jgi:hypothetical protein
MVQSSKFKIAGKSTLKGRYISARYEVLRYKDSRRTKSFQDDIPFMLSLSGLKCPIFVSTRGFAERESTLTGNLQQITHV